MEILLIILLVLLLGVALLKLLMLRREFRSITGAIYRIQGQKTNERVRVSTQDKQVLALANAVNGLCDEMHDSQLEHVQAMEELRASMANISHDLRTPLTSIVGYLQLLRADGNTPEQERHYIEVALRKASNLGELINNLFTLTRLDAGAYPLQLERLDVGQLLSEELAGFYDALTDRDIQPVVDLYEGSLTVAGDRGAIARIIANLLQNMLKHGNQEIAIASKAEQKEARLLFTNRAADLRPEDVDKLFQRFYTADRTRKGGESTGLGLSIASEFAGALGGRLEAALEGEMLTITLALPLIK